MKPKPETSLARLLRLAAIAMLIYVSPPILAAEPAMNLQSAESWRHFYFYGLADADLASIELDSQSLVALFSATQVRPAIASLALIDPRYIMNSKGLTAWLYLFVKTRVSAPDTLEYVATGKGFSFASAADIRAVFGAHNHWPEEVLARYPFDFSPKRPFILPFILPRSVAAPPPLSRSLVSPDRKFEIYGVAEFDEQSPGKLLAVFNALDKQAPPHAQPH